MKKVSLILAIVMVLGLLAGCGGAGASSSGSSSGGSSSTGGSSAGGQQGSGKDLQAVLESARPVELNELEMYRAITPADAARPDYLAEGETMLTEEQYDTLSEEEIAQFNRYRSWLNTFDEHFTGFVAADMKDYAISVTNIITLVYGVAIVLPEEGRQQAVVDQFNAFIQQQQKAMENYLQDQYKIAQAARVEVAPTGEVIMVMCEDQDTVLQGILDGLAA